MLVKADSCTTWWEALLKVCLVEIRPNLVG
jgi:hypothetical protein